MTPATATETAQEWRKRKAAELRQRYREGWEPRPGEIDVAVHQAEEAMWWGYEQGLAEQRELVAELRGLLDAIAERAEDEGYGTQSQRLADIAEAARALLARMEAQR